MAARWWEESRKGAWLKIGSVFGGKCLDSIKGGRQGHSSPLLLLSSHTKVAMAESETPTTTTEQKDAPTTAEKEIAEAIEEVLAQEVDPDEDPLELLSHREIAEVYGKLSPEDQRLFRQFKQFHKQHHKVYGYDTQASHLSRGIVKEIFRGLPTRDAETIAKARAEILAVERVKALCKQLGLKVSPTVMERIEAAPLQPLPQELRFPAVEDMETAEQTEQLPGPSMPGEELQREEVTVKEELDVKPPRRLATEYRSQKSLLEMVGQADEETFVTHVQQGTDPLQRFHKDKPEDMIDLAYSTEEEIEDADDLSEVSMESEGGVSADELKALLSPISQAHQKLADSLDALNAQVGDMSTMQVEDTAAQVASEITPIRGMDQVLKDFTREDIGLILAIGVRKVQEYQFVKGVRDEKEISSYKTLQEYFGANTHLISECTRGEKYRYLQEGKKRQASQKSVVKYLQTAEGKSKRISVSATATTSAATPESTEPTEEEAQDT